MIDFVDEPPGLSRQIRVRTPYGAPTLNQLYLSKIYCPHCRQPHQMAGLDYWLTYDDELTLERARAA